MIKKIREIVILGVALMVVFSLGGCENNSGKIIENKPFYSLQAAYNNHFITKEDIKTIARLHTEKEEYVLSEEKANEIKNAYYKLFPYEGYSYEDVEILEYLGEYKNSYAIIIHYYDEFAVAEIWSEVVADVQLIYKDGNRIYILNQGE